jgi:hypothetical protein
VTYLNYCKANGYPISDGWAVHIARGSLGGIDYAVPEYSPIYAPTAGWTEAIKGNGTGGWYIKFTHDPGNGGLGPGWRDEFLHVARFKPNDYYGQGAVIGYSGGQPGHPGAGSSTGPHIHWHLIDGSGTRVNPLDYITPAPTPNPPTPPTPIEHWIDDMVLTKINHKASRWNDHSFIVGQEYIAHVTPENLPGVAKVFTTLEYTKHAEFIQLVESLGIPRGKVDVAIETGHWSRLDTLG